MGPGIIIPVIFIAIVIPVGYTWAKNLKDAGAGGGTDESAPPPSARLTSNVLRELASPPWRVVYEIADDKLDGVQHVLLGPAGIFALETSMEPLPQMTDAEPDPHEVARVAISRGGLDDALSRCAMSSDALVTAHWGVSEGDQGPAIDVLPGLVAVDGRAIPAWTDSLSGDGLSPAQVDLAWQTVLTAIGRPDPLA